VPIFIDHGAPVVIAAVGNARAAAATADIVEAD
jgi:hypothetical protein